MFRSINNKLIYPITIFIALTLTACGGGSGGGSDGGVTPPPAATKADLSGLTLSAGTLMPPLQAGITSHTVNSPDDVSVTPVAQTDARMTVNGADVDSGETVALVEGANTIVVTHLDLTKTYTITINRLAASAFNQPARKAGAGKFAKQVALDGNTLVVGAPDANTVHIFVADGSGAWLPEQEITSSNAEAGDLFGNSVSISGDTLIVGAPLEKSNAIGVNGDETDNSKIGAGAAYIFTRSGTTWTQVAYLKASNTRDGTNFGGRVILSGDSNTAIVGSVGEKNTGENGDQFNNFLTSSGAAYVFNSAGGWSQTQYLKASSIGAGNRFGRDIALSGNTMAISAHTENTGAGAVYILTSTAGVWSEQAKLTASNADANDQFGASLDLDGSTLVVGALGEDSVNPSDGADNQAAGSGAVYVFTGSGANWAEQAYLKSVSPEVDGQFGVSVSLAGDELAIGAQGEGFEAGAAHILTRSGTTWTAQSPVSPTVIAVGNKFGNSVHLLSDGKLAVGAEGEVEVEVDPIIPNGKGVVYVFQK